MVWSVSALLLVSACSNRLDATPSTSGDADLERLAGTASTSGIAAAKPTPTTATGGDAAASRFSGSWKTDFSRRAVPLDEIISGGPGRDGIPPIDNPRFVSTADAGRWLRDNEPVIGFELGGTARAYPLQILIWHEIVNDVVEGVPVAITFCPLCNAAIAFDRRVERLGTLRFGTTGLLRHSDLIMWDDLTETWWQQFTGEAIVGSLTGTRLTPLPTGMISFQEFRRAFPYGVVLSRETGFTRSYGSNPYVGYDDVDQPPFLFRGKLEGRLPPMMRVAALSLNGEDVAYPYDRLAERQVIEDRVGGQAIVVFWQAGASSALDQSSIASSRDIGSTGVFSPTVQGRELSFHLDQGVIRDRDTGSTWNVLGQAISGPLAGEHLPRILHGDHFWFAWAVFKPGTRVWQP